MEGVLDGRRHTVFAFAIANRNQGCAAVAESGVDVVHVEIDFARIGNDFRNALCGDRQGVVSLGKSRVEFEVGVNLRQTFVVDDEKGVDIFAHLVSAGDCFSNLAHAFETEGYGHDADSEQAAFAGDAGDDRSGSCACATTHACGNENHVGLGCEEGCDFGSAFFGGFTRFFGFVACTATFCGVWSDEQFVGDGGCAQSHIVGVNNDKRYAVDFRFGVHVVDGVVAATADTEHHYSVGFGNGFFIFVEIFVVKFAHCHNIKEFRLVGRAVEVVFFAIDRFGPETGKFFFE